MDGKIYTFRAIIEKDDPGYRGYVPTLPGLHTCGDTIEEVRGNLKEALQCHLESLIKHRELIPQEEGIEIIQTVTIEPHKTRALPKIKFAYA